MGVCHQLLEFPHLHPLWQTLVPKVPTHWHPSLYLCACEARRPWLPDSRGDGNRLLRMAWDPMCASWLVTGRYHVSFLLYSIHYSVYASSLCSSRMLPRRRTVLPSPHIWFIRHPSPRAHRVLVAPPQTSAVGTLRRV